MAASVNCHACQRPPERRAMLKALNRDYHNECFVCRDCNCSVVGTFFEFEGEPYCERHGYTRMGLLCPECDRGIPGAFIAFGDKQQKYHSTCLRCVKCRVSVVLGFKRWKRPGKDGDDAVREQPLCPACFALLPVKDDEDQ